jgi:hypothetical protein
MKLKAPFNLIHISIESLPTCALCDSGSSVSLISQQFYQRLLKKHDRLKSFNSTPNAANLYAANNSKLKVKTTVDLTVRLQGITIINSFIVVDELAYNVILGADFLHDTRASMNFGDRRLILYDGLVSIPLSDTNEGQTAYTVSNVTIPPRSQAIFFVACDRKVPPGTFIIEKHAHLPTDALMVANTVVKTQGQLMSCCALNTTDKPIRFRKHTPIATVAPALDVESAQQTTPPSNNKLPPHAVMLAELQRMGVSFQQTSVAADDFERLVALIYRNKDLFALSLKDVPEARLPPLKIDTGTHLPVRAKGFRQPLKHQKEIERQVAELLEAKIIQPSTSPWESRIVLVRKPGNSSDPHSWRFCVDFRGINALTRIEAAVLPSFDNLYEIISSQKCTLMSTLDLRSAYHAIPLEEGSRDKTCFVAGGQRYEYLRCPFGLSNTGAHFQRCMVSILASLPFALAYLDDTAVLASSPRDMEDKLEQVFHRFRVANLRLHPAKCTFSATRLKFLGFIFESGTLRINQDRVALLRDYPPPKNVRQLRSWLGLVTFFKRFCRNFSILTHPLRQLLKKDTPYRWTAECQQSFDKVTHILTNAPVLKLPDFDRQFSVVCDASRQGLGFILCQKGDDNLLHPICYSGKSLNSAQARYSVIELECLAICEAVRTFHSFLAADHFHVYTDHLSALHLQKMKLATNSRLTRWCMFLQAYSFTVHYKPGRTNGAADFLSRLWEPPPPLEIDKNGTIQDGIESTPGPVTLDMSEPQSQAPTTAAVSTPPTEYTLLTFHHQSSETCVAAVTPPTLPSLADFREALPKCNDFRDMFAYLSSSKLPRNNNVARRILLDAQNYTLEDGLLYRHYKPRTRKRKHLLGTIKQLCVPTALRPKIVIAFHDGFTCHAGVDRTFETIRSRYWFPGCYAFIKQHVITCLECQQAKQAVHKPQVPILPLGTPQINSIFVADHHGPLVESDGKKYVLTIVDETSLWVELVAVASCDAQTFVNAFFDHVIARHGCPYGIVLRTDNGSAFISQVSKAFCESFGIKQVFSSPYHHTSIARAEQSFATVNNALKILCKDQRHWSRHLQAIAMGLRCTASSVSALSPFEIQFGRKMPLAIDIALMNEPPRIPSVEYYVADIKPKLAILNEIAMQCSAENAARNREVKNQKAVTPTFKLGDKVLVTNEAVAPNQSKKLIKRFAGPFFITSMENGFTYKLKHVMTGKELRRPVHASRLIAYKELENCYRLTQARSKPCLFVEHTSFRKIRVKVIVGDLVSIQTHAIVNQTDEFLTNNSGLAHQLAVAAGEEMNDECAKYITEHGRLPKTQPVCTTAGALAPSVKTIIHIGPSRTKRCRISV